MLPRLLCEELCSLNPLSDRLTLSVIWKVTPEGKVEQIKIPHSCFSPTPASFIVCHLPPPLDTERVVRPYHHPLLRQVELRPRPEHDRGPRETVFSRGTAANGPGTPHRRDPPGRAQPARHCQKPASSAFHGRGPPTRPGLLISASASKNSPVDSPT